MLLPSIMRFLDQNQAQLKPVEPTREKVPLSDSASALQKLEIEIAAAADLAKPAEAAKPAADAPSTGPFLEELRRALTKFEKSDESRVVDVFE